jgi:hypothetical protein
MKEKEESIPRQGRFHCECWELDVRPEDVEALLVKFRQESPTAIIQVFCAKGSPNMGAIEMIAAQTLTAAKSGSTLAERPELDLLLRLAGTRQIGEAFQRVGYKSTSSESRKRLFMVAACEGRGAAVNRLSKRASLDPRFTLVEKTRALAGDDLELVERAALLASRL